MIFRCFQGLEKRGIGNKWVNNSVQCQGRGEELGGRGGLKNRRVAISGCYSLFGVTRISK